MITIVTSTLNALSQLKHTANSIFEQSWGQWQWIIIDGVSKDGTKEWLKEVSHAYPNVVFVSEPDNGIYDAWNKALPLLQGEWVIFLGAGDKFKVPETLATCSEMLNKVSSEVNLAYGFVEYIKDINALEGSLSPAKWQGVDGNWTWCRPMLPNHQAVFHRRSFLKQTGFDTSFRIAGDTAMLLPELMQHGAVEMPLCITLRLLDGNSLHPKNRTKVLREVLRINRNVGLGSKRWVYQYSAFWYHVIKAWLMVKIRKGT